MYGKRGGELTGWLVGAGSVLDSSVLTCDLQILIQIYSLLEVLLLCLCNDIMHQHQGILLPFQVGCQ